MFRHLVRTIRSRFPQYLSQPFDVAELHQTILPYRHNRRELALESNEDYEITLTELLSGARDYMIVDDPMRDALRAELASVNPDPSAFKQFLSSRVEISPAALRSLAVGTGDESMAQPTTGVSNTIPAAERPTRPSAAPTSAPPPTSPKAVAPPPVATPKASRPSVPSAPVQSIPATPRSSGPAPQGVGTKTIVPKADDRCRSCGELLPAGRAITFCPHCGQNLTTTSCSACGSELEVGWNFCPACGKRATTQ